MKRVMYLIALLATLLAAACTAEQSEVPQQGLPVVTVYQAPT